MSHTRSYKEFELKAQYSELSAQDVVSTLIDAKSKTDILEKTRLLGKAIAGVDLTITSNLYQINNSRNAVDVPIQTCAPAGNETEFNSVVQPSAWYMNLPGGFYSHTESRMMKNCVGHWDGNATDLKHHIWNLITSPLNMSYHVIVLIALIFGIISLYVTRNRPGFSSSLSAASFGIIFGLAVLFDLLCVLFVLVINTIKPEYGKPLIANQLQHMITASHTTYLVAIAQSLPPAVRAELLESESDLNDVQIAGLFIIRYFYEPAISCLQCTQAPTIIMNTSKFCFNKPINQIEWNDLECLITVYRFVKIISESTEVSGSSEFTVSDNTHSCFKGFLHDVLVFGSDDTHQQLLRMLSNSIRDPQERVEVLMRNPRNISYHHLVDQKNLEIVIAEIKKYINKPLTAANNARCPKVGWDNRKAQINAVLTQKEAVLSALNMGNAVSSGMLASVFGPTLTPSTPLVPTN